jgi:hypothetical protein
MKQCAFRLSLILMVLALCGQGFSQQSEAGKKSGREAKFRELEQLKKDPNAARRYEEMMKRRHMGPEQGRLERQKELRTRTLERMKARQEAQKLRERSRTEAEGAAAKGQDHGQQLAALEKQMVREEQKRLRRIARLNRIRELALGEAKTNAVARVNKLLEKEQTRYERKRLRMDRRLGMLRRMAERSEKTGESSEKPLRERPPRPGPRRAAPRKELLESSRPIEPAAEEAEGPSEQEQP